MSEQRERSSSATTTRARALFICGSLNQTRQMHAVSAALPELQPSFTRPEVLALNQHLAGINWYRHCLSELRTVSASDTRQGP
jgi:hypothetical protein